MFATLKQLSQLFWSESVWTPPNITWNVYEQNNYRHYNDIYYSLITAVVLIVVRLTLEKYLYEPIGIYLGLSRKRGKSVENNQLLESAFSASKGKLNYKQIQGLSKQLDWSERQIQRWFRLRSAQNNCKVLSKFTESAWRCNLYLLAFIYGIYTLWDKPWMWDTIYCFKDYPHHVVSPEEWWYYNIAIGLYLSLLITQFFDIQRKDFWAMFVHHLVALILLTFSWACNTVRIGTLVLVIHDFADISLEGAKLMSYVKKERMAQYLFVIFAISWMISRILIFPYRIIYYSLYKAYTVAPDISNHYTAYYLFNGMLCSLQALNIFWTWYIVRTAIDVVKNDGNKDLRSDHESSDESTDPVIDNNLTK